MKSFTPREGRYFKHLEVLTCQGLPHKQRLIELSLSTGPPYLVGISTTAVQYDPPPLDAGIHVAALHPNPCHNRCISRGQLTRKWISGTRQLGQFRPTRFLYHCQSRRFSSETILRIPPRTPSCLPFPPIQSRWLASSILKQESKQRPMALHPKSRTSLRSHHERNRGSRNTVRRPSATSRPRTIL